MKLELNSLGDFAIILTIISILVIYFGKLIVKIKKIKKATILNEGILGFAFLSMYVLVPSLAIYAIINIKYFSSNVFPFLMGLGLILIQFVIFLIYKPKEDKKNEIRWGFKIGAVLLCIISFSITYYFIKKSNIFYLIVSLLFNIIILTFIAIKEGKLK